MRLKDITEANWIEITGGHIPGITQRPEKHHPHAPTTWWHGTSTSHLPTIQKTGLGQPNAHITQDRRLAKFSALRAALRFGGDPIVIKIDITNFNDTITGSKTDSTTTKTIPPTNITIDKTFRFKPNDLENFRKTRIAQGFND